MSKEQTTAPTAASAAAEKVNRAISWYILNRENITVALPIATPGPIFSKGWQQIIERYITLWQSGQLKTHLADAYIVGPLRAIKETLHSE